MHLHVSLILHASNSLSIFCFAKLLIVCRPQRSTVWTFIIALPSQANGRKTPSVSWERHENVRRIPSNHHLIKDRDAHTCLSSYRAVCLDYFSFPLLSVSLHEFNTLLERGENTVSFKHRWFTAWRSHCLHLCFFKTSNWPICEWVH